MSLEQMARPSLSYIIILDSEIKSRKNSYTNKKVFMFNSRKNFQWRYNNIIHIFWF